MFSSKSRITEGSDDDVIELSSSDHGAASRTKKRPLPDDEEVIEVEEARGKRASLRPLYDSDSDEKAVTKVKKGAKKNEAAFVVRTVKKSDRGAAGPVRGGRGGRAGGRAGKVAARVVKSKAVITDSGSAESDQEVQ